MMRIPIFDTSEIEADVMTVREDLEDFVTRNSIPNLTSVRCAARENCWFPTPILRSQKVRVEIFLERYLLHFFFVARVEPALLEAAMSAPDDTRTADAERLSPPLPSVNPIHLICAYLARRRPRCHPRIAPYERKRPRTRARPRSFLRISPRIDEREPSCGRPVDRPAARLARFLRVRI